MPTLAGPELLRGHCFAELGVRGVAGSDPELPELEGVGLLEQGGECDGVRDVAVPAGLWLIRNVCSVLLGTRRRTDRFRDVAVPVGLWLIETSVLCYSIHLTSETDHGLAQRRVVHPRRGFRMTPGEDPLRDP